MIVDCHTHWNASYAAGGTPEPAGWRDVLGRHGVTHSVVLPSLGLGDDCRIVDENAAIATACASSAGRMIPFCTVNLHWGKPAEDELIRCLGTLGHRGVKIHPWLQGMSPTSREMDHLCEIAGRYHAVVLFHDGTPSFSLPSQIALLARRHPETRIILGHCGLFEHWREAITAMDYADNLWGCLCGPHLAGLRELLGRCDPARLVWGSDFGYGQADPVGYRLRLLDAAGIEEADRRRILAENPCSLLGIPPATATKKPWMLRRESRVASPRPRS